jgi:hypothetical protein
MIPLEIKVFAAVGLLLAAFLGGWRLGGLSSAKQLADYKAAQQTALATARQAASIAQQQADAVRIAQVQAALKDAQTALAQAQADNANRLHTISTLEARIKSNAKTKTEIDWLAEPVPAGLLDGLCFYTGSGAAAACQGDDSPVRSDPSAIP